jgi:predicted PurR-regulated permease PerM
LKPDSHDTPSAPIKVTIGLLLGWILGIFFALGGIATLFSQPLPGVIALLLAVVFLPPANRFIEKRFHFSISGGVKFVLLLVLLALMGTLASTSPRSSGDSTADKIASGKTISRQNSSKAWHEVQRFSGKGNQDTAAFSIAGDQVRLSATTRGGTAGIGTFSGISLESESGGFLGAGLSISTEGAEEGRGETIYRKLKPGKYYVSIISGVNWEVKVEEYL